MTDILFPDVTDLVVTEIRSRLVERGEAAQVGTRVPNPRPAKFVLVRRVGGPRLNLVADNATLTIEAWGSDEAEAQDLLQLARTFIYAMRGTVHSGVAIYRIGEFAGPVNLPDPLSDQPRYTATMTVACRGSALAEISS